MLISWIIPLYNCGEYIEACIESLVALGLAPDDYEIIVVNDGSTDSSEGVMEKICARHKSVRLFSQSNQGVSAARNLGFEKARGEYVHFVDADDEIQALESEPNNGFFERLRALKPDIAIINFQKIYTPRTRIPLSSVEIEERQCSLLQQCADQGFSASTCSHVFRREILEGISFSPLKNGEDQLFLVDVYRNPNLRVLRTNSLIYLWLQRQSSASHSVETKRMRITLDNLCTVYEQICSRRYLDAYPPQVKKNFVLTYQRCPMMTGLLGAKFTLREIKNIMFRAKAAGVLPIPWAGSKAVKLLSLLSHSAFATWLAGVPYRKIYLKGKNI